MAGARHSYDIRQEASQRLRHQRGVLRAAPVADDLAEAEGGGNPEVGDGGVVDEQLDELVVEDAVVGQIAKNQPEDVDRVLN